MPNTALTPVCDNFFDTEEAKSLVNIRPNSDNMETYYPRDKQGPFGPITSAESFIEKHFGSDEQEAFFFCDPGTDDAIALFLALDSRSNIKPLMVIPSFGNVGGETTLDNATRLLALTNAFGVAVGVGAQMPMNSNTLPPNAAGEHGEDGLDGAKPEKPQDIEAGKKLIKVFSNGVEIAKNEIIRRYKEGGKPLTLVSTGSMTDIALILQALETEKPEAMKQIAGISIMGAGIDTMRWHTNITNYAEFNIYQDPPAAKIAFELLQKYKIPTLIFPLDLTHQTGVREAHEKKWLEQHDNPVARFAAQMYRAGDFDVERSQDIFGFAKDHTTRFMHDPNTITGLDRPELYRGFNAAVKVITEGPKAGQTIFENSSEGSVFVVVGADAKGVLMDWQSILSTFETDIRLTNPIRPEVLNLSA